MHLYAVARHEGLAREAVHELKYTPHADIATVLGPIMGARVPLNTTPLVVPVPLHWTRKRRRGFNQSELLARELAASRGWRVEAHKLTRVRRTLDQVGLVSQKRAENVRGAFRWNGGSISNEVLLVDDVYTTGSTMSACADALRTAGASVIHAAVFAYARPSGVEASL